VRYDKHFLADTSRNTGEYLEGSELFATEATHRACETLPPAYPAHVIRAMQIGSSQAYQHDQPAIVASLTQPNYIHRSLAPGYPSLQKAIGIMVASR
jgi:hypothetical protein